MWLNINFSNPINALHKNMYLLIDIRNVNWTPGHHAQYFEDSNDLQLVGLRANRVKFLSRPEFDDFERRKHGRMQEYLYEDLEVVYVADAHQYNLNRWEAFEKWSATTHWPHDNVVVRSNEPTLPDGTVDKRRDSPQDKPELTDRLLRLAGVKSY